jgi:hypothetical protein
LSVWCAMEYELSKQWVGQASAKRRVGAMVCLKARCARGAERGAHSNVCARLNAAGVVKVRYTQGQQWAHRHSSRCGVGELMCARDNSKEHSQ